MADAQILVPIDPDTWEPEKRIIQARPWITSRWLRARRDERSLPYTKVGETSPCLYRLRDIDALLTGLVTPAETGPLAEKPEAS